MFTDKERENYIVKQYERTPEHLKTRMVNKLTKCTGKSRATIYRIVKKNSVSR